MVFLIILPNNTLADLLFPESSILCYARLEVLVPKREILPLRFIVDSHGLEAENTTWQFGTVCATQPLGKEENSYYGHR